jgi:hypothetical protein
VKNGNLSISLFLIRWPKVRILSSTFIHRRLSNKGLRVFLILLSIFIGKLIVKNLFKNPDVASTPMYAKAAPTKSGRT